MLNTFINSQYCYEYLINQIPINLLFYGHLTVLIISVLFAAFIAFKVRTFPGRLLSGMMIAFSIWIILDLGTWFAFLGQSSTMFMWELIYLFVPLFFLLSYYFLYVFVTGKDVNVLQKCLASLMIAPFVLSVILGKSLNHFDANICEASENTLLTNYLIIVEGIFLISVLILFFKLILNKKGKEYAYVGLGIILFLSFFFVTDMAVLLLANYSIVEYAYNFGIYGLFGMPFLLCLIVYSIVHFKVLNVKLLATQALIWILIILVGSQFFFIKTPINMVLNGVTFVGAIISGVLIVRSVKRVDTQREELALANQEQETLVHFITHQIKGYFTKSRNIFDTLTDMENVPDGAQRLIGEGLRSDKEGVELVENILNAANLKTGKMQFKDEKGSLDQMVKKLVDELTPLATAKNLKMNFYCSTPIEFNADIFRLRDLFKNLISNSINYTFEGGITIYLNKKPDHAEFIIKDTGVGLTEDDKRKLFTSGGRGSESVKFNVSSTGYGLYIAKKVVDYYHGRIWAESEGRNKGTTFVVTLPLER